MCLVSTYLVGMNSHRNVDKMSLTSKNSDEQERWKEKKIECCSRFNSAGTGT